MVEIQITDDYAAVNQVSKLWNEYTRSVVKQDYSQIQFHIRLYSKSLISKEISNHASCERPDYRF